MPVLPNTYFHGEWNPDDWDVNLHRLSNGRTFAQIVYGNHFRWSLDLYAWAFVLKAKGSSWPCCLGTADWNHEFYFNSQISSPVSLLSLFGSIFFSSFIKCHEGGELGGEWLHPAFYYFVLKLFKIQDSRLKNFKIQIKVLRTWTCKIIISYFPLRSMEAYRTCQISAFILS